MRNRGARAHDELPVENFCHLGIRDREERLVDRAPVVSRVHAVSHTTIVGHGESKRSAHREALANRYPRNVVERKGERLRFLTFQPARGETGERSKRVAAAHGRTPGADGRCLLADAYDPRSGFGSRVGLPARCEAGFMGQEGESPRW